MKQKKYFIIMYIIYALPIPFSLITWIGTIISVADLGMVDWKIFSELIQSVIALVTMLLAGLYPVSYIISLIKTRNSKKFSLFSFLPIIHIILFVVFFFFWSFLNKVYQI